MQHNSEDIETNYSTKNPKTIIIAARGKNTVLKRSPEILIQPSASGKHIARVFDTP